MRGPHFYGAVAGCEVALGWSGLGCGRGFSGENEWLEVMICEVVWITTSFSGSRGGG